MPTVSHPIIEGWAWEPEISGWGGRHTGICSDKSPICMSVWTDIIGGGISVEAASPWISIADLMNEHLASDITLNTFEFLGYANIFIGAFATTALRVHTLKGVTEDIPLDIPANYSGDWGPVLASTSLVLASGGVAQYDKVQFKLYHYLDSPSHSVLAFGGTPQMNLLVTTLAGTSEVTFRVRNVETGFDLPSVGIVGTNGTRFSGTTDTGGTVTLTVYDGSYTVTARTLIGDTWYSGSTTFTAPVVGEVLIQVSTESLQLPWWWWIPVAAGGGLIALWAVLRMAKGRKEPTPTVYMMER